MTIEPTVALRPMQREEFEQFREAFIESWAYDLSRAEDLSVDQARQEATRRTDADLPDGVSTQGHHLHVVTADGRDVGTLWFSITSGTAFLDDITIAETERGRGYGRRALLLMEQALNSLGASAVRLNVYVHNPRARALYAALGYRVTGVTMRKRLRDDSA